MRDTTRGGLRQGAAIAVAACLTIGMGGTAIADELQPNTQTFVVKVAGDPTLAQIQASVPSVTVDAVRSIGDGLAQVTVSAKTTSSAQEQALNASPLVAAATPNRRFTVSGTPSPISGLAPWYSEQWDMWDSSSTARAGGYGVDAARAWTRTFGSKNVVVAVLDTGITPHPDLVGVSKVAGYDFVSATDGVLTGDGNGWDGDPSDPGDACPELDQASDWHGTFVTGEIAAQRDRSGVVGQAPGITIEPVRVLGGCGGTEADTIAAIEWSSGGFVDGVPANQHPAQVISMSLGSDTGDCSEALQTAIDDAIGRGSIVVAATGNDGTSMTNTSPANCAGVVSVAATTRTGSLASYSNRGTADMSPWISAPGGSDANPVIGDIWTSTGAFTAAGNHAAIGTDQGTSMATPRVSAAIALLLSVQPGLDPATVMQRLSDTATPFPSGSNCDTTKCGAGIVNAGDLVGAKKVLMKVKSATTSGSAVVGKRLTASTGVWRPSSVKVQYRWLRDGKPIGGATSRSYLLKSADKGHRIAVRLQAGDATTLTAVTTSASRRIVR